MTPLAPATKIVKSANSKHVEVASRDALSAQAFEQAARTGALGARLQALVTEDEHLRRTRSLKRQNSLRRPWMNRGARYDTAHWPKPHKRWLDDVQPTWRAHHAPAPWRDITDTFKAHLAHVALSLDADVIAFTLNLRADIELQAAARNAGACRWLANRISHHLGQALGRTPLFWFRIEESDGRHRYMHLHGEIACDAFEWDDVRMALRKAGGEVNRVIRHHQVKLKRADTGWIGYVMKRELKDTRRIFAKASPAFEPLTPSWRGSRFFMSQDLSRLTKIFYESVRPHLRFKTVSMRRAAMVVETGMGIATSSALRRNGRALTAKTLNRGDVSASCAKAF